MCVNLLQLHMSTYHACLFSNCKQNKLFIPSRVFFSHILKIRKRKN